ncbi:hypothetical protein SAMN06893096_1075 [Geodermatophilus pulveris]|uniref:Uncharacterized protein n=1 Tax=Geodermatophilus pulveris TaxID=1564159 RepID=A0A239GQH0_9ACTN|nr:hypothetical protein [Geodermatophilus pulveris]SNS71072.1 hypothetical protein SAMN06893096_1075 [Geodermatophilus pulveris]
MSALAAGGPAPDVLVPHWLTAAQREELAALVRRELQDPAVHPVAAVHLADVLTELHVAAARDAVWPASAARVRRVTGWGADVLPVRLSVRELGSVLVLAGLAPALRAALGRDRP